mmetsp:Transcript_25862/g.43287  ORF Transcript_25862/g.43287 Transcript_25862/m.43287 type:complete len:147 (+) Transcript_25862:98-538(+)
MDLIQNVTGVHVETSYVVWTLAFAFLLMKIFRSEPGNNGRVREVATAEDYRSCLNNEELTVVMCYTPWCPNCEKMTTVFAALSKKYANARFLRINVESIMEYRKEYDVDRVPLFYFFRKSALLQKIEGSNESRLQETIKSHYTRKS